MDTHIHAVQYPNIGLGYDKPLLDWLDCYTFPLEKKFSNTQFAKKVFQAVVVIFFNKALRSRDIQKLFLEKYFEAWHNDRLLFRIAFQQSHAHFGRIRRRKRPEGVGGQD